jgi:hypothetical protein
VLHDWLYKEAPTWAPGGPTTRAAADALLFEAMGVLGVTGWQRWAIYAGVRAGGWVAWGRYREAEAARAAAAMSAKRVTVGN